MKMSKLLSVFVFFIFTSIVHAEVKISIIDVDKVREESIAFKNAMKEINSKAEELDKNVMRIQKELSKKNNTLEKQKNVLPASEYNKKNDIFNKEVEKENKNLYQQRVSLEKAYGEANEALNKKIREVIQKIAREKNITIVFDKNLTVYSYTSIDVTKEVVSEINNQLKSIDINLS